MRQIAALLALLAPLAGCVVLEASADSSAPLLVVGGASDVVDGWPGLEVVGQFQLEPGQVAGGAVVEVVALFDWPEAPHDDVPDAGAAFVVRSPAGAWCRTEITHRGGQSATWRAVAELVVPPNPEDPAAVPLVASCRSISASHAGATSAVVVDAGGSFRGSLLDFLDTTQPIPVELAIGDVQGGASVRVVRWYARTTEPW